LYFFLHAAAAALLILQFCICVYYLHKIYTSITAPVEYEAPHQELKEDVESVNPELLERERKFDDRISRLKEELAMQQDVKEKKGTEAEILHPDIQNIPHDDVKTKYDLYPIEVAD